MRPSLVRNVLLFSLVAEGATGLAVALAPGSVALWLFGSELTGAGVACGRLLGVSLVALVIACWPSARALHPPAFRAMLAYNLLAAAYLAYLGFVQQYAGSLLWPAVVEHALVAALLLAAGGRSKRSSTAPPFA